MPAHDFWLFNDAGFGEASTPYTPSTGAPELSLSMS